jgi:hypothetical protein
MTLTPANNVNTIESLQDSCPNCLTYNIRRVDGHVVRFEKSSSLEALWKAIGLMRNGVEYEIEDMVLFKRVNVLSVTRADT